MAPQKPNSEKVKMDNVKGFFNFLETTSLDKTDKKSLISMMEFLHGNYIPELSNKSFLFEGEPGLGKTYLAEKLIESINLPVLFLGVSKIKGENIEKINSLSNLIKKIDDFNEGIIFIDDLRYSLEFDNEMEELKDDEKRRFMILLEHLKRTDDKVVAIMTLNSSDFMDESWIDRIEVKINFNLPSGQNKSDFLKKNFSKYTKLNELKYIAKNSVGYNYRDLPQLIKIAYAEGDKKINIRSIKKALALYNPSNLRKWNINRNVKIKFNEVIGHSSIKKELKKLVIYLKQKKKLERLGIKKSNLLIFSGSPGIGKTYMATALAGELNLPLVKIKALDILSPQRGISPVINVAKRFRNSVVFIDEVDKIVGGSPVSFDEEGSVISDFNTNIDEEDINGIVILAANNINRLGRALNDRFSIIKFDKPTLENRKEFIKRLLVKSKLNLNISEGDFANITENMNYREIQRVWNDCVFYYLQNNIMNKEILLEILSDTKLDTNKLSMFG